MPWFRCRILQHTLDDNKNIHLLEQIKTKLISPNSPEYQAKAMAQIHTSRLTPSIKNTQTLDTEHIKTSVDGDKLTHASTFRDDLTYTNNFSNVFHCIMPDELHNAREE